MQTSNKVLLLLVSLFALMITQGCISSKPVETSSVVDDRPVLMFSFEGGIPSQPISIYIDDLYLGEAQKYQQGKLGLRIIAGTHIIQLRDGNRTILDQKIYLGRGVTKTIAVSAH